MIAVFLMAFLNLSTGLADGQRTFAGGRSLAMGGTAVAVSDFWSLWHNQAGAAWLKVPCAGFAYENRYLIKELRFGQFGFLFPFGPGAFGLTVNHFGNSQYREIKAGLTYARKIGRHFSASLQLDYLRFHCGNGYGSKNLASCEIGLMYHTDNQLSLGVHLVNPIPVTIAEYPAEQLPSVLCAGLSYSFSEKFLTALEIEKDLENPFSLRAGAEYHFARPACARVGITTSPASFTFGIGLEFGNVTVDFASGYHQALGFSPAGSIIYLFR